MIFKLGDGERVVSVARLPEVADENGNGNGDEPAENPNGPASDQPGTNEREGDDR